MILALLKVFLKTSPLYLGVYFVGTGSFILGAIALLAYGAFVTKFLHKLYKEIKQSFIDYEKWFMSLPWWKKQEIRQEQERDWALVQLGLFALFLANFASDSEEILNAELEASQAIHDEINGRNIG